jgi:excisionase family DNA binding protein
VSISPITNGMTETDERPSALSRPMTPRSAAEYLGLDEKTVTRWARCGYLPAHPLGEGKRKFWRFLEPELEEWLMSKTKG